MPIGIKIWSSFGIEIRKFFEKSYRTMKNYPVAGLQIFLSLPSFLRKFTLLKNFVKNMFFFSFQFSKLFIFSRTFCFVWLLSKKSTKTKGNVFFSNILAVYLIFDKQLNNHKRIFDNPSTTDYFSILSARLEKLYKYRELLHHNQGKKIEKIEKVKFIVQNNCVKLNIQQSLVS